MNLRIGGILFFVFCFSLLSAQLDEEREQQLKEVNTDTLDGWKFTGNTNLNFAQSAFVNWTAGGNNSYSLSGLVALRLSYKKKEFTWENNLSTGYGFMVRSDVGFVKTDDKFDFDSKVGHLAGKGWYYSALLNFKTQYADGYSKTGNNEIISRFLAPAYFIAALGIDKKFGSTYSLFIAPICIKSTFVMDKTLSDRGAFGVNPGKTVRAEAGAYVKFSFQKDIMANINLKTKVDFFSDYVHHPENIDINWESIVTFKVNKYISATITASLVYDDDIKIGTHTDATGAFDSYGPRTQFKEVLGIGFAHKFK
jgi:hypothetical protein